MAGMMTSGARVPLLHGRVFKIEYRYDDDGTLADYSTFLETPDGDVPLSTLPRRNLETLFAPEELDRAVVAVGDFVCSPEQILAAYRTGCAPWR